LRGWLLDTNVIGSLIASAGAPSVKAWAKRQDEELLYISVITLAELDKGIAQLADADPSRARYAANRDLIMQRLGGRVLPVSDNIMRLWGALAGRIKRDTGHPPPVIDTMLAATALEHQLYLVTRNTADVKHTGATVFNPWEHDHGKFTVSG
jgi:predicted nucleic acid-binding protein